MLHIEQLDAARAAAQLDELIDLLQDAVASGASIGFLPPMARAEAAAYWRKVLADLPSGERLLFVAWADNELAGAAQLALESRRNGDHRGEVQKLMVRMAQRRRGIGRQLMTALETAARAAGRTLLVLDTRQGDPSEQLYQSLGYVQAGVIPQYARSGNGELHATVFYYRLL